MKGTLKGFIALAALVIAASSGTAQIYTAPLGAAAFWRAEGNAQDSIGVNHGTMMNGASYAPRAGGQAFSFNGNGQYMVVPSSPALSPTAAITLAGWFYANDFSGLNATMLAAKDSVFDSRDYQIGIYSPNGSDYYFRPHVWVPSGLAHFAGATKMEKQRWYHVAMTYDGAALNLYVNGVLDGTMAVTGPINQSTSSLYIGGFEFGPWSFNGQADDVILFQRALSQGEVQGLMAVPEPAISALLLLGGAIMIRRRNNAQN